MFPWWELMHSSLEEMIEEGVTGFLARNGDAGSFREATERLLALPVAGRDQMRQSNIAATARRVSEDCLGQLLDLYERVVMTFSEGVPGRL